MKFLIFVFTCFCSFSLMAQDPLVIDFQDSKRPVFKTRISTEVKALVDQLKLYTLNADNSPGSFPVMGAYHKSGDTLSFQPKFALSHSVQFQIQLIDTLISFQLPATKAENPISLARTYPNKGEIPSNILTFYLEFSEPMKLDPSAYKYINIIKQNGDIVDLPWRQRSYWINDNKTLVLMIHPGRVKEGIHSTYNLEPIFVPGEEIYLRIEAGLTSINGREMKKAIEIPYLVTKKDLSSPLFIAKATQAPQKNSKQSLKITFSEKMDYGLIYKWFLIERNKVKVNGSLQSNDGLTWFFTPAKTWEEGNYSLQISNKLGDLCHNQTDRLFEVAEINDINKRSYKSVIFTIE